MTIAIEIYWFREDEVMLYKKRFDKVIQQLCRKLNMSLR